MPEGPHADASVFDATKYHRLLVTGAAGFIASRVCHRLLDEGCTIVAIDNLNDAYDVRLKHWRLAQLQERRGFEFHRADVTDREVLRRIWDPEGRAPFDAVINLAARAGVRQSVANPWVYVDTNLTATLNLLELCRDSSVTKFVLASTSSVYGDSQLPFSEDGRTDRPLSPYAASKKAAEVLCYTYHQLYGIDVTVLRYFTVYGPAGRPDMSLFRFVQWISESRPVTIYGDGTQSRDFTYVDDIADGTVRGLRDVGYEIINLGSDRPVVLNDAVAMVEQLVGKKAGLTYEPRHTADVMATWADIGKARRLLGWEPKTSFHDGARRLVDWYNEERSWARDVETG